MKPKRIYFLMIGALCIISLFGMSSLVVGNKLLSSKASKLSNLRLKGRVLDDQQTALARAKKDVEKYTPLNNIAETVVPQEKDQALAVREIIDFAGAAKIVISSITFPASNLGQFVAPLGSDSKAGSNSNTKILLTPSQLLPVQGLPGIYELPITIQSDIANPISFDQLIALLKGLESNRHTAEVSQLTITPSNSSGQRLSFEIVINVFIKR